MSCLHLPVTANSPVKLTKIFTKDYASYNTTLSGEQYDLAIIIRLFISHSNCFTQFINRL